MKFYSAGVAAVFALAVAAGSANASTIFGVDGLGSSEQIISFNSATPSVVTSASLGGRVSNETILNIAFQPSTGVLFGLGAQHLYTIDTSTDTVTQVGGTLSQNFGSTQLGFGFDPVTGLIHIVTNNAANLVMDPTTGAITPGTSVAFASGDVNAGQTPSISSLAFSNNFSGASSTTMYDLNVANELATLTTQNESTGGLTTIGNGIGSFSTVPVGFTIDSTGAAFASLERNLINPGVAQLYSVNLGTGALTLIDTIGGANSLNVESIAAQPSAVPEPASLALAAAGIAGLLIRKQRRSR